MTVFLSHIVAQTAHILIDCIWKPLCVKFLVRGNWFVDENRH